MNSLVTRSLNTLVALGAAAVTCVATLAQTAPAYFTNALTLSAQIRAKGEAGVFTSASGVALNRYGGNWSGSDLSFYTLSQNATDGLPMNYTKCAPLISRLLRNTHNFKWNNYSFYDAVLTNTVTTASPFPYQMIAMMDQGKGFSSSFTDLTLAQAGDIICWSRVANPTDDHAALFVEAFWNDVVAYPTNLPSSNPALAGTTFVTIRVVDSTSSNPNLAGGGLHGDDSRRFVLANGTVKFTPGIGTGLMGVLVNADGEILGHTWSLPTNGNPLSADANEVDAWVDNLNDRLEWQSGASAREMVIGRVAL